MFNLHRPTASGEVSTDTKENLCGDASCEVGDYWGAPKSFISRQRARCSGKSFLTQEMRVFAERGEEGGVD